ncbi:MAG: N-acetyl-gamma-glutamyl-phosphate reductase [Candidatus Omnitrophica bacterium]|nr:N-acetyl-gamma-glutamyl-phosphate reductase [Candidatus Omnitrophota bacterium]
MVNVGIVGATGYTGEELIDILLNHPNARVTSISSRSGTSQKISEIFPKFTNRTDLTCDPINVKEINKSCDIVFLALPHTVSMDLVPNFLKAGKKVIDLSADYRIKNLKTYEKYYQLKHKDAENVPMAVYGLPEIYRLKIRDARLIANPGCYPTVAILSLAPLVAFGLVDLDSLIIDAKSGVTGAGRKLAEGFLFSEVNDDFKAYKVGTHQHAPEIDQELSKLAGKKTKVTFVPHLLPLNRGILATIYVNKSQAALRKKQSLIELYKKFYKKEPFVRIKEEGNFPRLKDVAGTNFCDIAVHDSGDKIIVIGAIDNLLKGASGQAVQNMNIICGYPETAGLL